MRCFVRCLSAFAAVLICCGSVAVWAGAPTEAEPANADSPAKLQRRISLHLGITTAANALEQWAQAMSLKLVLNVPADSANANKRLLVELSDATAQDVLEAICVAMATHCHFSQDTVQVAEGPTPFGEEVTTGPFHFS